MKAQGETRCVLSKWRDAKFDFENESRCDIIVSKVRDSSVFQSGHLRVETVKFLFVSGIILYRRTLDFSTKFVYDRGVQIYGTASWCTLYTLPSLPVSSPVALASSTGEMYFYLSWRKF